MALRVPWQKGVAWLRGFSHRLDVPSGSSHASNLWKASELFTPYFCFRPVKVLILGPRHCIGSFTSLAHTLSTILPPLDRKLLHSLPDVHLQPSRQGMNVCLNPLQHKQDSDAFSYAYIGFPRRSRLLTLQENAVSQGRRRFFIKSSLPRRDGADRSRDEGVAASSLEYGARLDEDAGSGAGGDEKVEGPELRDEEGGSTNDLEELSPEQKGDDLMLKEDAEKQLTILQPENLKQIAFLKPTTYFLLSEEMQQTLLPEGLPTSMQQEFASTASPAILLRKGTLDLISCLKATETRLGEGAEVPSMAVDGKEDFNGQQRTSLASHGRSSSFLLEGPSGSGKSFALAQAVAWARANGWLVLYVPSGQSWLRGGFCYPCEREAGGYDTPLQARSVLQAFLAGHATALAALPMHYTTEPIGLGEGPGTGPPRGSSEVLPDADWTLLQLCELGRSNVHASCSVLVRLRKELGRIPCSLVAIDEFNAWFHPSEYSVMVGERSSRRLHPKEIRTVATFRSPDEAGLGLFLGASSESLGGISGKIPEDVRRTMRRFQMPRQSLQEARTSLYYYHSRLQEQQSESGKHGRPPPSEEEMLRFYCLTNGNGAELRRLACLASGSGVSLDEPAQGELSQSLVWPLH
eukprot:TRINITY_DN15357_c0_g1_i1.p1 TRINITY_DN15357_c0_g1~~TRINITY_DN15357_c0_g1_i1.p1  ORF type:complete len:634 (+),score=98.60 TRINITY_DN15357_c0_g1_i1:151-2052(+)